MLALKGGENMISKRKVGERRVSALQQELWWAFSLVAVGQKRTLWRIFMHK